MPDVWQQAFCEGSYAEKLVEYTEMLEVEMISTAQRLNIDRYQLDHKGEIHDAVMWLIKRNIKFVRGFRDEWTDHQKKAVQW